MRRSRSLAALVLGAVVVLWLGVATAGGVGGAGHPGRPHLPDIRTPGQVQTTTPERRASPVPVPQPGHPLPAWVGETARVVAILAALALVAVVGLRIARAVSVSVPREAEGEVAASGRVPVVDVDELRAVTGDSLALLRTDGDIAAAITACWRRLEDLAARSGAARESWQSTQEYVVEVLGHTPAPEPAVVALAQAYRTVCYSAHAPSEGDRRAAVAALEAIDASLDGVR